MQQLLVSLLAIIGTNEVLRKIMLSGDDEVSKPVTTVSIIIPSYNEEKYIVHSLQSIFNQSIIRQYPELFEIILVDGRSTDNTVNIAKLFPSVKIVFEPRKGKLTARNTGIDHASGNIILAADSDRIYPTNSFNALLKPFQDNNVIGTCGSNVYSDIGIFGYIQPIGYTSLWLLHPSRLDGGNSAFRKEYFYKTGKFNDQINQINFNEVVLEEEINLGLKLSQFGRIVPVITAGSIHIGNDKVLCRSDNTITEQCSVLNIGTNRM
jgi:glycosyltransferase involved in cell wall biosynthesis